MQCVPPVSLCCGAEGLREGGGVGVEGEDEAVEAGALRGDGGQIGEGGVARRHVTAPNVEPM